MRAVVMALLVLGGAAAAWAFDATKAAQCVAYAAMAPADAPRNQRAAAILAEAKAAGAFELVMQQARAIIARRDTSLEAAAAGQRACDTF